MRCTKALLIVPLLLAGAPTLADSQSSNSSSNCSNGRCSRVESFVVEDGFGRRGYVREERWRERDRPRRGRDWPPAWHGGHAPWFYWAPPRHRRGDDDDDD